MISHQSRSPMKYYYRLLPILFTTLFTVEISAQDLYTGLWRAGADGYSLYKDLSWEAFVSKWQQLGAQNQRLADISTYTKDGIRLYNGVWRSGTDGYALYGGLEWSAFVSKWQELGAQNLRLIDIETYTSGSIRLYIGVWRAGTDGYALYNGLTWTDFVSKWQQMGAQNLRLIDVTTYVENGIRLYTGVWRAGTDPYGLYNGLSWANFSAKAQELAAQNLRLINLTSYLEGNTRLYLGVWRAGSDAYALWDGTDWESFISKWAESGAANLRLINLETYESNCDDLCLNNVLMDDNPNTTGRDTYSYKIPASTLHCEQTAGTCGAPAPGSVVTYSWPNLKIGTTYYMRNSVVFSAKDKIFTLPFSDAAASMTYEPWMRDEDSWHHAIDYQRTDSKTFQIKAAAAGTVIYIGWDNTAGNTMIISHDVGTKKDVYRTIYMHLQNGPLTDCNNSWTKSLPALGSNAQANFRTYLNNTGCPEDTSKRKPLVANWGKESQKIKASLLGQKVTAGQLIAWSGSTGSSGCDCTTDGTTDPNTHLHIFFAHRDSTDSKWYLFDPYGIYSFPSCYPTSVNGKITTCSRYPVAWKSGNPKYPAATALSEEISSNKPNTINPLFISPNPSSGKVRITYKADKAGNINLIIYDKSGAAVFRKNDYAVVGNNIYELNLYSLISGAYYIELNYNYDLKARQQFIISR